MTSARLVLTFVVGLMTSHGVAQVAYDTSVCTPGSPTVPLPNAGALLGSVWQANIEWKDEVKNRTYYVTDTTDMTQSKEKVVISAPFLNDVTLLFDWNTYDVIMEKMDVDPQNTGQSSLHCEIFRHQISGGPYSFDGLFWLTSIQNLIDMYSNSQDAILQPGSIMIRGTQANKWTACLYDWRTNMTLNASLYFSMTTWMSPFISPGSQVPLRMEFKGKVHNGSASSDVNLIGDIIAYKKMQVGQHYPAETFTTMDGAYCPNRTGEYQRFPGFASQLSLVMEVIETDFTRISYKGLYYDKSMRMVRYDEKSPIGDDSNPTTYIADFGTGVKYLIDCYTMSCTASALNVGDDFVTQLPNNTLDVMPMENFFHSANADIQFVGQAMVRGVECNSWVGRYFDDDTNRYTVVQWYYTTSSWSEATGNVQGSNALFMMKVWRDGSNNPMIYNILKWSPLAPDPSVYDFSTCFNNAGKKHFVVEFNVGNLPALQAVNRPYLKQFVVQELANRVLIQINRFTDVSFDLETPAPGMYTTSLFMSATMLERTVVPNGNQPGMPMGVAFSFLRSSIISGDLAFNLTLPGPRNYIPMTGIGLIEHNFKQEFTSTAIPTVASTTKIVAPTVIPPTRPPTTTPFTPPPRPPTTTTFRFPTRRPTITYPTTTPKPCPTSTPCPACPSPTTPATPTCPTPPPCVCTTPPTTPCPKTTCPPPPPRCPAVTPCPSPTPCVLPGECDCRGATTARCPVPQPCPTTPKPTGCTGQQSASNSPSSGISAGALAGGVVVALILGLAIGIIATRFYHITNVKPNTMTINLIDDNM